MALFNPAEKEGLFMVAFFVSIDSFPEEQESCFRQKPHRMSLAVAQDAEG